MSHHASPIRSARQRVSTWFAPLALAATAFICASQQGCVCLCMVQEGGCNETLTSSSSSPTSASGGGSSVTTEGSGGATEGTDSTVEAGGADASGGAAASGGGSASGGGATGGHAGTGGAGGH